MNTGVLLIGLLILLVLLGMPVPLAIGFASMTSILNGGFQMAAMAQKMFSGIDSFVLLAIPYFILAGNIMAEGKITDKILDFASAALGWMRGSLAIITVAASAIFAALTGSGVATVSAIGGITIPAMRDEGYHPEFATAVAANAAILGPLIPPSVFLITYGSSAELDISALFKAADQALYTAKRTGSGKYCFYSETMQPGETMVSRIEEIKKPAEETEEKKEETI